MKILGSLLFVAVARANWPNNIGKEVTQAVNQAIQISSNQVSLSGQNGGANVVHQIGISNVIHQNGGSNVVNQNGASNIAYQNGDYNVVHQIGGSNVAYQDGSHHNGGTNVGVPKISNANNTCKGKGKKCAPNGWTDTMNRSCFKYKNLCNTKMLLTMFQKDGFSGRDCRECGCIESPQPGTTCAPNGWMDIKNLSCSVYSQKGYCKTFDENKMKVLEKDGFTGLHCKECGYNESTDSEIKLVETQLSAGAVNECLNWSEWKDRDDPTGSTDSETITGFWTTGNQVPPADLCSEPIAAQGRNKATHQMVTTQKVKMGLNGLTCVNAHNKHQCFDYEVRFCCPSTKCSPKEWKDKMNRSCLTYSKRGYCNTFNNLVMRRYQKDGYTGTSCKECGCNESTDSAKKCAPIGWVDKYKRSCATYKQRNSCETYAERQMKMYQKDGYTGRNCKECGCIDSANLAVINWKPWTSWGACSVSCDTGTQKRQRACHPYRDLHCKKEFEKTKIGLYEIQLCNTSACPVTNWNTWSSWGVCSVTCDGGTQKRDRTCYADRGTICMEAEEESQLCNTLTCRKKCEVQNASTNCEECECTESNDSAVTTWNAWGSWAACSVSCNGGTQKRDRSCNANGGPACWRVEGEYKLCNIKSCPVTTWNTWSSWGICSVKCDGGTQKRHRTCNFNGAALCRKVERDSQLCNTRTCHKNACGSEWWFDLGTGCSAAATNLISAVFVALVLALY